MQLPNAYTDHDVSDSSGDEAAADYNVQPASDSGHSETEYNNSGNELFDDAGSPHQSAGADADAAEHDAAMAPSAAADKPDTDREDADADDDDDTPLLLLAPIESWAGLCTAEVEEHPLPQNISYKEAAVWHYYGQKEATSVKKYAEEYRHPEQLMNSPVCPLPFEELIHDKYGSCVYYGPSKLHRHRVYVFVEAQERCLAVLPQWLYSDRVGALHAFTPTHISCKHENANRNPTYCFACRRTALPWGNIRQNDRLVRRAGP